MAKQKGMSREDFDKNLTKFIDFTCDYLKIKNPPEVIYKEDCKEGEQPSFAGYAPHTNQLYIYTKNRHPMDVFRSVAHELVHHKQNEDGKLGKDIAKEGSTGSDIENEANSVAGQVMRYFGRENPFYFDMSYITENRAIILAGTPGSGKDKILKEGILSFGYTEVSPGKFADGNIVVTGSFTFKEIKHLKEQLESNNYKTMLVFVNTSDSASKQRNEQRAEKGGRVISEVVRFAKWQDAQEILYKSMKLFETFYVFDNSCDASVLREQYVNNLHFFKKAIKKFTLEEIDYNFENMINEVGGAGNFGTDQLRINYQRMTPGQENAITTPSGQKTQLRMTFKDHRSTVPPRDPEPTKVKSSIPHLSIGADRIGAEYGYPKSPTMGAPFDDNESIGLTAPINDPVGRWMVKEQTRAMFKKKYGELAEKKLRETAEKLKKSFYESLIDPYTGGMSDISVTGRSPDDRMLDPYAEVEKTSLFRSQKSKKLNNKSKLPNISKEK